MTNKSLDSNADRHNCGFLVPNMSGNPYFHSLNISQAG